MSTPSINAWRVRNAVEMARRDWNLPPLTPDEAEATVLWGRLMAALEVGIDAALRLRDVLPRLSDPLNPAPERGKWECVEGNLDGIGWSLDMALSVLDGDAVGSVRAAQEELVEQWMDDDEGDDDEPEDQLPPDEPLAVELELAYA